MTAKMDSKARAKVQTNRTAVELKSIPTRKKEREEIEKSRLAIFKKVY